MNGSQRIESKLKYWSEQKGSGLSIIEIPPTSSSPALDLTYRQLWQKVQQLRAYVGAEPQVVLLALPGGIADAIVWLACLTGGHTLVPVSPELTANEFEQSIRVYKPAIIISDTLFDVPKDTRLLTAAAVLQIADTLPTRTKDTKGAKVAAAAHEGHVRLATSGSTGKPKGILLTAKQCALTAQYIIESHQLTVNDRGLTPLPFHHVNAPIVSLLSTILSGGTVIIAPKYSTTQFWDWVENYRPTWISLVPAMLAMLLGTARPDFLDKSSAQQLRFIRTASAPLPIATLQAFEATFKIPVVETYGMSEAASTIVANPVPPGVHKAGSVGLPIGIDLRIFDADKDTAVGTNTVGEVHIRGQNIIPAYVDNADAQAFVNGWLRTGDLGYIDDDGYVFLTGRSKDIIIRGGENIFPRQIEEVIAQHPEVREAVVVGQPDQLYGEKVVAFVIARSDAVSKQQAAVLEHDIMEFLRQRISRTTMPSVIYLFKVFPKTKAGKIDKPYLRQYQP